MLTCRQPPIRTLRSVQAAQVRRRHIPPPGTLEQRLFREVTKPIYKVPKLSRAEKIILRMEERDRQNLENPYRNFLVRRAKTDFYDFAEDRIMLIYQPFYCHSWEWQPILNKLHHIGFSFRGFPVSVLREAAKNTKWQAFADHVLREPIVNKYLFGSHDPAACAKALAITSRTRFLTLIGGVIGHRIMTRDEVKTYANFGTSGGLEALHSQLITGCGIVYCRTREDCETVAFQLTSRGLRSSAYHAGLSKNERTKVQEDWSDGAFPIVAATISFGMGVDKSNVRCVVHWTVPKSLASYYQESGRAGRDGETSFCRIYYCKQERDTVAFLVGQQAEKTCGKKKKDHRERGVKDLALMINYVESVKCRHAQFAAYFGDAPPPCVDKCDCCLDPTKASQQLAAYRHMIYNAMVGCSSSEGDGESLDTNLYRRIPRKRGEGWEEYEENGESMSERFEEEEKRQRANFISRELARRRQSQTADAPKVPWMSAALNSPLIDPENKTVTGLTGKYRDQTLHLLIMAGCSKLEGHDSQERPRLVDLIAKVEHKIFKTSKVAAIYRGHMARRIAQLRKVPSPAAVVETLSEWLGIKTTIESQSTSVDVKPSDVVASNDLVVGKLSQPPIACYSQTSSRTSQDGQSAPSSHPPEKVEPPSSPSSLRPSLPVSTPNASAPLKKERPSTPTPVISLKKEEPPKPTSLPLFGTPEPAKQLQPPSTVPSEPTEGRPPMVTPNGCASSSTVTYFWERPNVNPAATTHHPLLRKRPTVTELVPCDFANKQVRRGKEESGDLDKPSSSSSQGQHQKQSFHSSVSSAVNTQLSVPDFEDGRMASSHLLAHETSRGRAVLRIPQVKLCDLPVFARSSFPEKPKAPAVPSSRSALATVADKTRLKTNDVAKCVVPSLSRFYSSGSFIDKDAFKAVARELTRRILKSSMSIKEVQDSISDITDCLIRRSKPVISSVGDVIWPSSLSRSRKK
ncbi:hypothetical protein AAHC03_04643 [Spirometra sp. Aus1]